MLKKEMPKASDGDLITNYVLANRMSVISRFVFEDSEELILSHLEDLEAELLKRQILTQEQIDIINM